MQAVLGHAPDVDHLLVGTPIRLTLHKLAKAVSKKVRESNRTWTRLGIVPSFLPELHYLDVSTSIEIMISSSTSSGSLSSAASSGPSRCWSAGYMVIGSRSSQGQRARGFRVGIGTRESLGLGLLGLGEGWVAGCITLEPF